jgi:hypothetical protein
VRGEKEFTMALNDTQLVRTSILLKSLKATNKRSKDFPSLQGGGKRKKDVMLTG